MDLPSGISGWVTIVSPQTDLSSDELQSMCQFFDTWTATFGKPF
ncbi:MAG: hypothetical protein R3C20_03255 [Planctomycetaceae bacterium]